MVSIVRPKTPQAQSQAQISLGVAGQTGRGLISAGEQLSVVGKQSQRSNQLGLAKELSSIIDQEGKRLFAESKASHQSAVLLDKTTQATEAFINGQKQRYDNLLDKDGNPTFETLPSDIEAMGKQIADQVGKGIIDKEVAKSFKANFASYVSSQKITALKEASKQQADYGIASLNKNLDKLILQGSGDTIEQIGTYEQNGIEALQGALQGGLITHTQFESIQNKFSDTLRSGAIRNAIQKDRKSADMILEQSPEALGLRIETINGLKNELAAARRKDASAKEAVTLDQQVRNAALVDAVEEGVETGSIDEAQLLGMEDKVSKKVFKRLKTAFVDSTMKRQKAMRSIGNMAERVKDGESLQGSKPGEINAYYEHVVKQQADTTGKAVSLTEKAKLAAQIPQAVDAFTKETVYKATYGNLEEADDIISAYTYIKDRKKPTFGTKMNAKTTEVLEYTELLMERGGMSAKLALKQARETILQVDKETLKNNKSLFGKEKSFKPSALEETAAENLEGAEATFGTNLISDEAKITFGEFARAAYLRNPDKEAAIASAKQLMSNTHGISTISGTEQYMFNPPEKAFKGEFSPAQLRHILLEESKVDLPEGSDLDTIGIEATDLSANTIQVTGKDEEGNATSRDVPTWMVTYINKDGIRVPLIDPKTGQTKMWTPLGTKVLANDQLDKEEEFKAKREKAVDKIKKDKATLKAKQDKLLNDPLSAIIPDFLRNFGGE